MTCRKIWIPNIRLQWIQYHHKQKVVKDESLVMKKCPSEVGGSISCSTKL